MIGVAGFGAGGDDGEAAFRSGDAFGFAEVFAQERIDGMADAFRFVGLEEAEGQNLGGGSPVIADCGVRSAD